MFLNLISNFLANCYKDTLHVRSYDLSLISGAFKFHTFILWRTARQENRVVTLVRIQREKRLINISQWQCSMCTTCSVSYRIKGRYTRMRKRYPRLGTNVRSSFRRVSLSLSFSLPMCVTQTKVVRETISRFRRRWNAERDFSRRNQNAGIERRRTFRYLGHVPWSGLSCPPPFSSLTAFRLEEEKRYSNICWPRIFRPSITAISIPRGCGERKEERGRGVSQASSAFPRAEAGRNIKK